MTEQYIDFCIDLRTLEGSKWLTIEAAALISHNNPTYADDLVYDIESYWVERGGKYQAITDGLTKDLINYEDEIGDQVFDKLVGELELPWRPNEHRHSHHEYGLGGSF